MSWIVDKAKDSLKLLFEGVGFYQDQPPTLAQVEEMGNRLHYKNLITQKIMQLSTDPTAGAMIIDYAIKGDLPEALSIQGVVSRSLYAPERNKPGPIEVLLIHAAEAGHFEITKRLLDLGANPFWQDGSGKTALSAASDDAVKEMVLAEQEKLPHRNHWNASPQPEI